MCMTKTRGVVQLAVVSMMVDLSINGVGVIRRLLFVDVIILDFIILYFMIIDIYIYTFFEHDCLLNVLIICSYSLKLFMFYDQKKLYNFPI